MLRAAARAAGGHATLFRGGPLPNPLPRAGAGGRVMPDAIDDGVFTPLPPAMLAVHRALKLRFDPHGILNRGRLYPEF
jgi:glycolate oxidase FAD binding subunit